MAISSDTDRYQEKFALSDCDVEPITSGRDFRHLAGAVQIFRIPLRMPCSGMPLT